MVVGCPLSCGEDLVRGSAAGLLGDNTSWIPKWIDVRGQDKVFSKKIMWGPYLSMYVFANFALINCNFEYLGRFHYLQLGGFNINSCHLICGQWFFLVALRWLSESLRNISVSSGAHQCNAQTRQWSDQGNQSAKYWLAKLATRPRTSMIEQTPGHSLRSQSVVFVDARAWPWAWLVQPHHYKVGSMC